MGDNIKFSENVILVDVTFLNEIVYSIKNALEMKLNRKLPHLDLPAWLSYLALDSGLRGKNNEVEVILVHEPISQTLNSCEPSDLKRLDNMACRTSLGEFLFSSVSSSGLVSTENLFLDLMNLALDSADVKCLMLLPFHPAYSEKVEDTLYDFFKGKNEEERKKAVYFTMEEPLKSVCCRCERVFYSLAHAFGINSDDL